MHEERLQILRMIQEGIISAEEGAKLMEALRSDGSSRPPHTIAERAVMPRRWLRIRVIEKASERVKVNLTVPFGLIEWGLNFVENAGSVNLIAIREAMQGDKEGKILEVDESGSGERIEISVE